MGFPDEILVERAEFELAATGRKDVKRLTSLCRAGAMPVVSPLYVVARRKLSQLWPYRVRFSFTVGILRGSLFFGY
jgi:hypothetical protein